MNYGKLCLRFGFVLTFILLSLPLAVSAASQVAGDAGAVAGESPDIAEYIRAAKQGGAEEQYKLGQIYQKGQGVAKDEKEAAKWFRRAADQGHAASQWRLGLMYHGGKGVVKDGKEAIKWLRRASDQGDAEAQASLGAVLILGNKDDAEALKWIRRAVDQNLARGQNLLGWMYLNGRGVAKDEDEALKWLRASARQGNEVGRKQAVDYFNYDALDDDGPIPYEEHLKAHSLELAEGYSRIVASGDGKRMVLPLAKKGEPKNFVGMSLWEYNPEKGTFVKHPFRFLRKAKRPFAVAISWDGALMAYADSKDDAIVLVDLDTNRTLRKIKHDLAARHIAISRDNETLAVQEISYSGQKANNLTAYSVKQGTQRGKTTLPLEAIVESMSFAADSNLVVSYFITIDAKYSKFMRIYNDKLQSMQIEDYSLAGIDSDGYWLALSKLDLDIDEKEHKTRVYDLRSRQWKKTNMPLSNRIYYGPVSRFITDSLTEYLLNGDKTLFLQNGPTLDLLKRAVLYVAAAQSWLIFNEDRLIAMSPVSETVVRTMTALEAGRELLQVGFHQSGAAKVREAMAIYPVADRLNDTGFYAELADKNVPLRYIGELLLAQYNELLKNATDNQKEKITKAVERLRDYGLFAFSASHPDLVLQAAQRIRFLQSRYPDAVSWDQLLKNAVALEALHIAAKQSPARAYEHILDQGGLLHDDYLEVVNSINNWKIKSYWFLLYSDLNKLAYLLKRDASKLKKPEVLSIRPQAYPDLSGRIIESGSPVAPALVAPAAPVRKDSATKGRILD